MHVPQVEHLDDVAVVQAHRHVGLVDQHVAELRIGDQRSEDALEHHRALEALDAVLGAEKDLGHAAVGDLASDVVAAALRHGALSYFSNMVFAETILIADAEIGRGCFSMILSSASTSAGVSLVS